MSSSSPPKVWRERGPDDTARSPTHAARRGRVADMQPVPDANGAAGQASRDVRPPAPGTAVKVQSSYTRESLLITIAGKEDKEA